MIYQKPLFSKIAIVLSIVAIARANEICDVEMFHHDGQVCGISGAVYVDAQAYCDDAEREETWDYGKHAIIDDCDAMVNFCTFETTNSFKTASYEGSSAGELYDAVTECKLLKEEFCYRTVKEDPYMNNYEATSNDPEGLPECCRVECDDRFVITRKGCGSDGINYEDIGTFCDAYCLNRTLDYTECGQPGCGEAEGCPSELDMCKESIEVSFPICGSDGILYATADAYCTVKVAGDVDTYSKKYCDFECVEENCVAFKCDYDLEQEGYEGTTICGSSATFYNSINEYCHAVSINDEDNYVLCDGAPCLTQSACDDTKCENKFSGLAPFCATNLEYYDVLDDFCTAYYEANAELDIQLCGTDPCTEIECCQLRCEDINSYDICDIDDYQLVGPSDFCSNECDTILSNYNTEGCVDDDENQVNCTQTDCDYKECVDINTDANGETHNYCSNTGVFFTTTVDYCEALKIEQSFTAAIDCNGTTCGSEIECCENYCKQEVFQNGDTFESVCNSATYEFIDDVDLYCEQACTTGTYTAITAINCTEGTCTEAECCIERCENTEEFNDVCSNTYDIVPKADCATQCDPDSISLTCDEDCVENDCDLQECRDNLTEYPGTMVCAKDGTDTYTLYADIEAYCNAEVADATLVSIECEGVGCTEEADCCYNDCLNTNDAFVPLCDLNFNIYSTVDAYCTDFCGNGVDILQCGENNCNEDECKEQECLNETYLARCDPDDDELLTQDTYCNKLHDPNLTWEANECTNDDNAVIACTDCEVFKCEAEINFTRDNLCLTDAINGIHFFASVSDYCDAMVTDGQEDFTITSEIQCDGDTNCADIAACCEARCKLDAFDSACESTSFELYDQNRKCTEECAGDTLDFITCDGGCTADDCAVLECEDTLASTETEAQLCLSEAVEEVFYFDDLNVYCTHLVNLGDKPFTIGLQVDCGENTVCSTFEDCCDVRCLDDVYTAVCETDTYSLVSQETFCDSTCRGTPLNEFECDNEGIPESCTESDCCVKELEDLTYPTQVCGTDGTLYVTHKEFCDAQSIDATIERFDCTGECSERECFVQHCLDTNDLTTDNFPLCGSDGNHYTTNDDFCDARFDDNALVKESFCHQDTCEAIDCCNNLCPDTLDAVLGNDANDDLIGFDNLCLAQCSDPDFTVVHECTAGQTVDDCIADFQDCSSQCADEVDNTTDTYCSLEDNFLTAYEYCLLYVCSTGDKINDDFTPVNGCEQNDCDEQTCTLNTCLNAATCVDEPINIICAKDGKAYEKDCIAACHATEFVSDCTNPEAEATQTEIDNAVADCNTDCLDIACNDQCLDQGEPVCGADGEVYGNTCIAECHGTTMNFDCSFDCRGNLRNLRCEYDCMKSI